jgi:hypothetical protein
MFNDLSTSRRSEDMELHAYNAAFYELGLRFHWDSATWDELACVGECRKARLRHYLQTRHPHLLRAYDADFLVDAIERAQAGQRRLAESSGASSTFDWSKVRDCELGH